MGKTGFTFGQCVRFTNLENQPAIGYVVRPTNLDRPCDFFDGDPVLSEREYFVVYCDRSGNVVYDEWHVPESLMRPYVGWIPDDVADIPKLLQQLLEDHTPPGPVDDDFE